MAFLQFLWISFRRTGWVGWLFVAVLAVMVLALPGVWLYQAVSDSLGGGNPVVDLPEDNVVVDGVTYQAPDLTREAELFRESLGDMSTVIASIPTPTATAVVSATPVNLGGTPVVGLLLENPAGVPLGTASESDGLDWFTPERGLDFFRVRGGDWTTPEVREASPYRSLVEYEDYPPGTSHFADGTLIYDMAVKLAFGMVEVRPNFGTPTPAMIATLSRELGWELLPGGDVPAFRVWSTFRYRAADTAEYLFAVGGVMVMNVGELPGGAQYLIAGDFVPPGVVLQRLEVSQP